MPSYKPLFTPVSFWQDAPIGTLGFLKGNNALSKGIDKLEPSLGHSDFIPTHVFIKFNDEFLIEAIQDAHANSVAALQPFSKYASEEPKNIRYLTPPGDTATWRRACVKYINEFGSKPYGTIVLVGFALQHLFSLKKNPFGKDGFVCSQGAWEFLRIGNEMMLPHLLASFLGNFPEGESAPLNLYQAGSIARVVV